METTPLRWGIIGTGLIASWFVSDLVQDRAKDGNKVNVTHIVQAIGSSSLDKATAFREKHIPSTSRSKPSLYDSYQGVYNDPDVDVVYIATPHALHLQNTLDAIQAGKHVLCEKPAAVNAKDLAKMISAAREKGVYLLEGVWTRFFPLTREFERLLHVEQAIGEPRRALFDFALDMPLDKQAANSRTADIKLGAGALLDIGIYTLTWARLTFNSIASKSREEPNIQSSMILNRGVDEMTSVTLNYPKHHAQAICTSSYLFKSDREFGRVEGTEGSVHVLGRASSRPDTIIIKRKGEQEQVLEFPIDGWGFFYEANAVAEDIASGKLESTIMPLEESLTVMKIMDRVRSQNGLKYPQDD